MRIILGLALFASACTGTIGTGGGDDDTTPPPPATDVQITVHDGAAGRASVRVLFQDATGATLTEATTDANGFAKAEMPNGGNLTVIRTYVPTTNNPTPTTEVFTYIGVKGGDRLQLGHEVDDLSTPGAISVTVPTDAQPTVKITTPCGSGQGTGPNIAITATSCPAMVTFFVEDGGQNSFFAKVPYANGIDLSAQSLVGTLTTSLSSSNLGPDMTSVDAETYVMDGSFMLYASGSKRIDATPQTVNLPNLHGIDELVVATITAANGAQMVATRQQYVVQPTTIDASAHLIPYINTVKYEAPNTMMTSPTANQISWVETGTGTADFVLVTLDVQAQTQITPYKRVIIAPHGALTMMLPLLSGADAMYNPTDKDQVATTAALVTATGGYDAMRANAFSVPSLIQLAAMNGAVTVSYDGNTPPTL
jgi:hypothetical protein